MSHLSLEILGRLVDEPPEAEEARHLEACPSCREELAALRMQTAALAALPDPALPDALWARVETRLRAEGIVRQPFGRRVAGGGWIRYAAALALFAAGGLAGWGVGARGEAPVADAAPPTANESPVQLVRSAEAAYLRALASYAEQQDVSAGYDPVARLAALESIMLTSRAALNKAPADPLINGYYLTAVAQREAMLRQLDVPADTTWF